MQHNHQTPDTGKWWGTVSRYVFIGFVAIALFFLITEHRAHLIPYLSFLPFLLLAACPLMHLFHHHGHDHESREDPEGRSPPGSSSPPSSGAGTHQH